MIRKSIASLLCVLVLLDSSCYTRRVERLEQTEARNHAAIHTRGGQSVRGYTTADGSYRALESTVVLVGDTLEFRSPGFKGSGWDLRRNRPGSIVRVPRDSVRTLFVEQFSPGRTAFAVIGVSVLVIGVVFVAALAAKESCPFIYSWDGQQYVFDGEPYGGATMRSLERTDWSELDHLIPDHGAYRLMLTNEVDETQHTDRLGLVVVDHAPGTTAVMDRTGRPHAFRHRVAPGSAHDGDGVDLTRWLREVDPLAWTSDLAAHARPDSLADTRDHITLAFPRPAGVDRVWLVTHVSTGQWGSHLIRTMLGFRGNRVGEFYAAINGSAAYREQLETWNRREELFALVPEVRAGDHWVRQDFIPGGGPFVSESRAVPLDLTGVTGDSVVIRIHPPVGFWSLNAFALAWDDVPATLTRLAPRTVTDAGGANVRALLAAEDSLSLDFPTRDDLAHLEFAAPPQPAGLTRTVFAETRGWYEVHLHDPGPPDLVAIQRLTAEPGYIVRRGLKEFAEMKRTGVLQGVPASGGR